LAVGWRVRALADIAKLAGHVARDNPYAAARIALKLRAAGDSLSTMPLRGRPGRQPGTRELVVIRPYVIVYRVAEPDTVTILRIWHTAQDRPEGTA